MHQIELAQVVEHAILILDDDHATRNMSTASKDAYWIPKVEIQDEHKAENKGLLQHEVKMFRKPENWNVQSKLLHEVAHQDKTALGQL